MVETWAILVKQIHSNRLHDTVYQFLLFEMNITKHQLDMAVKEV